MLIYVGVCYLIGAALVFWGGIIMVLNAQYGAYDADLRAGAIMVAVGALAPLALPATILGAAVYGIYAVYDNVCGWIEDIKEKQ